MTEFNLTITEVATYAAKEHVARIIASSPGFFYGEDEALEVLSSLPLRITFEAEQEKGEETLAALHKAGCELSYTMRNMERAGEDTKELTVGRRFPRFGLAADYTDEQLETCERRFNRIPKVLWSISLWFLLSAWIGGIVSPRLMIVLASPALIVVFVFAALAAISVNGVDGYALAVGVSIVGTIASGLLALLFIEAGIWDLYGLFLFVGSVTVCAVCVHLFFTLLHRPIREWFD